MQIRNKSRRRGTALVVATEELSRTLLAALDDCGNALAYADAHCAECVAAFDFVELIHRGGGQSCAARAERVSDCDRATVWIYVRGVVGEAQIASDCESLRRASFV